MQIYFMLLALVAGCWCAHSQNTVSGKIIGAQSSPLDGAHIHIEDRQAVTDPGGNYKVTDIPDGSYRVVISYIGYKSLDTLMDITSDIVLNTALKPEATELEEVVLTDNAIVSKNTVHGQRLSPETIEKYSSATLGDALKEIAGVYTLKTGNTIVKPIINGLHSSRVPIISNNVRLEDQQWGTEHAPNLDISSAGKITVIKGAGALQYGGDAVGGIVVVQPASVLKDTLYGKTLLDFASNGRGSSISSTLHKGNEKGWAWNIAATRKYFGDRETPDYTLSNTGNRESNFAGDVTYLENTYSLSASYSLYSTTIGIAKAMHIGNVADLVRAINSGEPAVQEPFTYAIDAPKQEVQHHLAKLGFEKELSTSQTLSLQYAFQLNSRKEFDIRRGDDSDKPALDLTLITHSGQADWTLEKGDTAIKAGISALAQDNDASPDTGIRPLIPAYSKYDAGAYGIFSYRFTDSFSAEAGVRYDFSHMDATKFYQKSRWDNLGYNGVFDDFITADFGSQWLTNPRFTFHNFSASLGARKNLQEGFELFANASLAVRNPNPAELFSDGLHHSNGTIELGNLALDKEQAVKLSLTLAKDSGAFRFDVSPFANIISDFIYLQPTGIEYTIRGAFPVYNYTQANALLAGVDLQTDWQITKGIGHRFSLAYVHGTTGDEPLPDMTPLNITNSLRYTSPGSNNLWLELRSEAVFSQSRYPNNNFYAEVPVEGEFVSVPVDVSTPPPGYHLLHFGSGITFRTSGKSTATVGLSIHNIFNSAYRDYLNRQRLYTDDTGRNFLLQLKFNY